MDTDSIRKCTTTAKGFYATWLIPEVWKHFSSEEDYFDTRVLQILRKFTHKVLVFKAQFKHEYENNTPLNHIMFSMYNLVRLNLAGCEIIRNVDFLQIMSDLHFLDLSRCPAMSTASLIRSVPHLTSLVEFICTGNDVRVSAFSVYQCVRNLPQLHTLDMSDSGTMRPWLARKLCYFCKGLRKFYFTTYWSLDEDNDNAKVAWYKLVKRKYPHVEFTEKVQNRVAEYMEDCRAVKMQVRLDEWEDEAVQHNPL